MSSNIKKCYGCGCDFHSERKSSKFCNVQCVGKYKASQRKAPDWIECSKCLASIGFGFKNTAKILHTTKAAVMSEWKRAGVKAAIPVKGSWHCHRRAMESNAPRKPKPHETAYKRAAISEIRSHRNFPDWSCLWAEHRKIGVKERKMHAHKQWVANNRERCREIKRRWMKANPEKMRGYRKSSINRAVSSVRKRFRGIMKRLKSHRSTNAALFIGCSPQQLKRHLESLFKKGMGWDNYGTKWHIDHIIPCASFNHSDENQIKLCWHWTNLRPLGVKENLAKSDSITEPQMSLLLDSWH